MSATGAPSIPPVSIVIPTFNRLPDLRRTMEAIFQQSVPTTDLEVIVVDNSSTDGTQPWVESLAGERGVDVRYVRKVPEGPAAARNTGIQHARGEFILFVDSDVELERTWIATALDAMRANPRLGCLGGAVVYAYAPARLNAFGGEISPIGLAWDTAEGEPLSAAAAPRPCLWLNCSAMMTRTAILRDLGGFDPEYFYGYEDSDFGWRVNLAGYAVEVTPSLVVTHHVDPNTGASAPKIVFHYTKNRLRSVVKNYGLSYLCTFGVAAFAVTLLDSLLRAPRMPKLQAVLWNISALPSTLRERGTIQNSRRITDRELAPLFARTWFPPTRLAGRRRRPSDPSSAAVPVTTPARDDRIH